jgi:hypothetical protein
MPLLHFRIPNKQPPQAGFALKSGYRALHNNEYLEKIYLGAQISDHQGAYFTLLTQSIGGGERSLLQCFDDRDDEDAFLQGFKPLE